MVWRIEYAESVQKVVNKINAKDRERIYAFLENRLLMHDNPYKLGKALTGNLAGLWRYRVGNFRVIAKIDADVLTLLVLNIGHRSQIYTR